MTGSGRETKLAVRRLLLQHRHRAAEMRFLRKPTPQQEGPGEGNVKFSVSWHSVCSNHCVKGLYHLRSASTELSPNAKTRVASRQMINLKNIIISDQPGLETESLSQNGKSKQKAHCMYVRYF